MTGQLLSSLPSKVRFLSRVQLTIPTLPVHVCCIKQFLMPTLAHIELLSCGHISWVRKIKWGRKLLRLKDTVLQPKPRLEKTQIPGHLSHYMPQSTLIGTPIGCKQRGEKQCQGWQFYICGKPKVRLPPPGLPCNNVFYGYAIKRMEGSRGIAIGLQR